LSRGRPCLRTPFNSWLERRAVFDRRITERGPFALGAGRLSRFVPSGFPMRWTSPSARSTGPSWCLPKITPRRAPSCLGSQWRTVFLSMRRLASRRARPRGHEGKFKLEGPISQERDGCSRDRRRCQCVRIRVSARRSTAARGRLSVLAILVAVIVEVARGDGRWRAPPGALGHAPSPCFSGPGNPARRRRILPREHLLASATGRRHTSKGDES